MDYKKNPAAYKVNNGIRNRINMLYIRTPGHSLSASANEHHHQFCA